MATTQSPLSVKMYYRKLYWCCRSELELSVLFSWKTSTRGKKSVIWSTLWCICSAVHFQFQDKPRQLKASFQYILSPYRGPSSWKAMTLSDHVRCSHTLFDIFPLSRPLWLCETCMRGLSKKLNPLDFRHEYKNQHDVFAACIPWDSHEGGMGITGTRHSIHTEMLLTLD